MLHQHQRTIRSARLPLGVVPIALTVFTSGSRSGLEIYPGGGDSEEKLLTGKAAANNAGTVDTNPGESKGVAHAAER